MLENHQGKFLVSKRVQNQHQGGLWEFPGGKVEPGENMLTALKREMKEELDYTLVTAKPLKKIIHKYPTKLIQIAFWHATSNKPKVYPNENQPLKWVSKTELMHLNMPKANLPIISLLVERNE